jgi:D-alanyl-lipoteichoic acid acyltransferase DltB (MBOAT superfamily)
LSYTDKLFLALFGVLFIVSTLLRNKPVIKEGLIIGFSLIVILSWGLTSLLIFLTIALLNFAAAPLVARYRDRRLLTAIIAANLFALAAFKYHGFISGNLQTLSVGLPIFALGIPLAISFYTFHLISYLVELNAGRTQLATPRQFLFFLSFFPHVVAGPIVRPWQFIPQVGKVRVSKGDRAVGLHHLAVGIFLKAVIANNLAAIIDPL